MAKVQAEVLIDGGLSHVAEHPRWDEFGFNLWRLGEDGHQIMRQGPHFQMYFPPVALFMGVPRSAWCRSVAFEFRGPFLGAVFEESPTARESEPGTRRIQRIVFEGSYQDSVLTLTFSGSTDAVAEKPFRIKNGAAISFNILCSIPVSEIPIVVSGRSGFFIQKHFECETVEEYLNAIRHGPPKTTERNTE